MALELRLYARLPSLSLEHYGYSPNASKHTAGGHRDCDLKFQHIAGTHGTNKSPFFFFFFSFPLPLPPPTVCHMWFCHFTSEPPKQTYCTAPCPNVAVREQSKSTFIPHVFFFLKTVSRRRLRVQTRRRRSIVNRVVTVHHGVRKANLRSNRIGHAVKC